jgi:long-chain fatty acid transport protein
VEGEAVRVQILVMGLTGLLLAGASHAGGLYVNELSTSSQGNAGAGRGAWVDDASASLHNAASMTRLDDHALSGGLSVLTGKIHFDADAASPSGGGNGGNQLGTTPLAGLSYVHRLSDRMRFGFNLFSMSGSVLNPENAWEGRYQITRIALVTLSMSPSIAYRVTDWLSIGGGPIASFGMLDWKLRANAPLLNDPVVHLDGLDDWAASGRLGLLFHPNDRLAISASWTSKTDFDLDGDVRLGGGITAALSNGLPLAQFVEVSAAWQVSDQLQLLATFDWEDWSEADELAVTITPSLLPPRTVAPTTGFRDTYKFGLGGNYRLRDDWLLQAGFMYDSSALKDADRTAALPVDRQLRASLGVRHAWSPTLTTGLSFTYLNLGRGRIEKPTVSGEYDANHLFIVGVTVDFKRLWWGADDV